MAPADPHHNTHRNTYFYAQGDAHAKVRADAEAVRLRPLAPTPRVGKNLDFHLQFWALSRVTGQ